MTSTSEQLKSHARVAVTDALMSPDVLGVWLDARLGYTPTYPLKPEEQEVFYIVSSEMRDAAQKLILQIS